MNGGTSMSKGLAHFVHGKESGPNGIKIAALAEVARQHDWDVASLDYLHTADPALRLEQLRKPAGTSTSPCCWWGRAWAAGSRRRHR